MLNIAAGFNSCLFTNSLNLHDSVSLVEIGFTAYHHIFEDKSHRIDNYNGNYSLHLSRTPITERIKNQEHFIRNKLGVIKPNDRLESIGYHLSGERTSNIGKYGFTSHYTPCSRNEARAVDFIKLTQDVLATDVWLENANFYSPNLKSIFETWESIIRITEQSSSKIIFDISHLVVDCLNCNVSPEIVIGMIPWSRVKEIHLSGIIKGKDGTMHDGHSVAVHDMSWKVLDLLLNNRLLDENTYINIEHTDICWGNNKELYLKDFDELSKKITPYKKKSDKREILPNADSFAKNYTKKLLIGRINNLDEISKELGTTNNKLLEGWLFCVGNNAEYLCLFKEEEDLSINNKYIITSFCDYIERTY